MDTSKLKIFASNARDIIKEGVRYELRKKGFDDEGHVVFGPTKLTNGTLFDGQILEEHFYDQWVTLYERIGTKGIDFVYEETAYTWFNRLIALQILSKNHIINEPVLQYVDADKHIPYIIDEARNGRWTNIDDDSRARAQAIINDHDKTAELFSILIASFCRNTPIINKCFGGIAEYTEILLPSNILAEGNFISMLNDTPYITDEDYGKTELLGWLYQFYIAKKKKEVNEKTKWEADEVPAGTQIFTPNWIVKYMVENTLGRIYLDHDTTASFKDSLKYLVKPCEGERPIYEFQNLEDLKCGDLSCGSGHILNEFFDLLIICYQEEGYDTTTAIESIFRNNLVGVDLDTRAKQLSMFSLLLKACILDKESFIDAHCMPRVLDMPKPYNSASANCSLDVACLKFVGGYENVAAKKLAGCFDLLNNSDELGSVMKFNLDDDMIALLRCHFNEWTKDGTDNCPPEIQALLPGVDLILAFCERYSAICMNPPYMAAKHMDNILSNYVSFNYPTSKNDLFSVFMDVAYEKLQPNAKYGMINMQAWMYNKYFTAFRENLLKEQQIDSLLHLGPHTFDELGGEIVQNATFVITKHSPYGGGIFYRLVEGDDCNTKERLFLSNNQHLIFPNIDQARFSKIRLSPMGSYWASDSIVEMFESNPIIEDITSAYQGLSTAANNIFIRNWYEVDRNKIGFNISSRKESVESNKKWFPTNKGGGQRKWYGNHQEVINWENDGYDIRNFKGAVLRADDCHFKPTVTWNMISGTFVTFRYFPKGFVLNNASNAIPVDSPESLLALLQSKITTIIANILNATTNLSNGVVARFPYLKIEDPELLSIIKQNIEISKDDWNSHETSWDFEFNPIIALRNQFATDGSEKIPFKISALLKDYKAHWDYQFKKLLDNEEELNRQFITTYGLEDELTPDIPKDEITILQEGEMDIVNNGLKWHDDVLVKQLISYAMGCWMGRYRLDRPGLNVAHPNPKDEETAAYSIYGQTFKIDDDGIVPLLPSDSPFTDNAINRLEDFIRLVFGENTFKDNWNFITNSLGKTEEYFTKPSGFWKDHKSMYQKAPIYWLFSSRGGYFKCLVYMHRMTQFTARDLRDKYLLKYIEYLRNMLVPLKTNEATLGRDDKKKLVYYENALKDCEEYDLLLNNIAQKFISFDLDDGVKVNYAKFKDVLATI